MIITLACTWQQAQAFVIIGQEEIELYLTHARTACADENFKLASGDLCDLVTLLGEDLQVVLGENTHQKITMDALDNLKWRIESAGSNVGFVSETLLEIAEANEKVDLVQTPDRHFDAEAFYDANFRLKSLRLKVIEELTSLTPSQLVNSATVLERGAEARQYFGQLLHTLQDFYAHSNWVEQQIEAGNASNPNVLDRLGLPGLNFSRSENNVICDEFSLGAIELTSGDYLGESPWSFFPSPLGTACDSRANKCAHGPNWLASISNSSCGINKDAAGRTHNDLAVLLAKNHSAFFANHLVSEVRKYYGENKLVADAAVCAFLGVSYTEIACQKQLTIQKYRKDTVEVIAGGKVEVVSGPIDCGETCSGPLLTGSRVELKASSKGGFNFVRWHIDSEVCPGSTDPDCIVTMDSAKIAKAVFEPIDCYTTSFSSDLWVVECSNADYSEFISIFDGMYAQLFVDDLSSTEAYRRKGRWDFGRTGTLTSTPGLTINTSLIGRKLKYQQVESTIVTEADGQVQREDLLSTATYNTSWNKKSPAHPDSYTQVLKSCQWIDGEFYEGQVIESVYEDGVQVSFSSDTLTDAGRCASPGEIDGINGLQLSDSLIYQCIQDSKYGRDCL